MVHHRANECFSWGVVPVSCAPVSTARSYASLSFLLQCVAVTAAYAVSGRLGLYLASRTGA